MGFWSSIKSFFGSFGGFFRDGMEKFLADKFKDALRFC